MVIGRQGQHIGQPDIPPLHPHDVGEGVDRMDRLRHGSECLARHPVHLREQDAAREHDLLGQQVLDPAPPGGEIAGGRGQDGAAEVTRGSGSCMAATTRVTPAAMIASVQGGALPQWQHGSSVT